jgi:hypothetical protein
MLRCPQMLMRRLYPLLWKTESGPGSCRAGWHCWETTRAKLCRRPPMKLIVFLPSVTLPQVIRPWK